MITDDLLEAVDRAPDTLLELARRDCHARHVDSIPLSLDAGRLTRVFLAWPGHALHRNHPGSPAYTVGVHDHRYDLRLRLIRGRAVNYSFELDASGRPHTEWRFTSGVVSGQPITEEVGPAGLRCRERQLLGVADLEMRADELHTVWVPEGVATAWQVEEGETRRETTRLFTNTAIDTAGLYGRFRDAADVRQRVRAFIEGEGD